MLGDIKFLDTLRTYEKDNIPPEIMKKIREKYRNSFKIKYLKTEIDIRKILQFFILVNSNLLLLQICHQSLL